VPRSTGKRPDVRAGFAAAIHRALDAEPATGSNSAREMAHELNEILREGGSWGDADTVVSTAVAEARIAQRSLGEG